MLDDQESFEWGDAFVGGLGYVGVLVGCGLILGGCLAFV